MQGKGCPNIYKVVLGVDQISSLKCGASKELPAGPKREYYILDAIRTKDHQNSNRKNSNAKPSIRDGSLSYVFLSLPQSSGKDYEREISEEKNT